MIDILQRGRQIKIHIQSLIVIDGDESWEKESQQYKHQQQNTNSKVEYHLLVNSV